VWFPLFQTLAKRTEGNNGNIKIAKFRPRISISESSEYED
jgi:hypothetical protein